MDIVFLPSEFDWDKHNVEHVKRHHIEPSESEEVFFNQGFKFVQDPTHSKTEERFIAIGATNLGRHLFVSFTFRGSRVRIITARDMRQKERRKYHEEKTKKSS